MLMLLNDNKDLFHIEFMIKPLFLREIVEKYRNGGIKDHVISR